MTPPIGRSFRKRSFWSGFMANLTEATAPRPEGMFPGEAPADRNNYRFSLPGRCIPLIQCITGFVFFLLGQERATKSRETTRTFSLRVFSWIVLTLASRPLSIIRTPPLVLTSFICALQALRFACHEETLPAGRSHGNRRGRCRD